MKLDASNETGYGYGDGEGEEPSIVKSEGKHCIGSRAGSSRFECEGAETAKMAAAATDIDDGGGRRSAAAGEDGLGRETGNGPDNRASAEW